MRTHANFLTLLLIILPALAWSQTAPSAQIAFADDEYALEITDAAGQSRQAFIGDEILAGDTLKTGLSSAEIKLVPNGSIIKVAVNTIFKLENLAAAPGAGSDTNEFALLGGKIRTVAARTAAGNKYRIRTPTAVCGVRGTDFSLSVVEGVKDAVFVKRGSVEFSRALPDGGFESIMVGAGQFADVFGASFSALAMQADQLAGEFADLEFKGLDPEAVAQDEAPTDTEEPVSEEKDGEATTEDTASAAVVPVADQGASSEPSSGAADSKLMSWLGDMLGFEIGSVVINENTYSKAIIQPTFSVGKLRMGLYLPIIYTSNLFDPGTWYRPAGNDEWSFGGGDWTDDPLAAAQDAAQDLALKIRFMEYGEPLIDPFYIKVGNLSNMSIGHGILMRNFANDSDFPAMRRVGINTGIDTGAWGAEAVVNDLGNPEVFGGRLKMLHIFGVTAIADINPAADLATQAERDAIGDPYLIGSGVDIDLPLLKFDWLNLRAYADLAAVIPYTNTEFAGIPAGLQTDTVYDSDRGTGLDALRNYGFVSGFMGRMILIDWRLEFRHYRGAYRPTFFDASYERNRTQYAQEFAALLLDPASTDYYTVNGIYGEAGFSVFKDKIALTAGYMMPWSPEGNVDWTEVSQNDYLLARLVLKKGLIPLYDISGSISYERTGFAYALAEGNDLFDAEAVFKGELVLPIADTVDFAVVLSSAAVRNEDGEVVAVDPAADIFVPKVEPTITFETRIHF